MNTLNNTEKTLITINENIQHHCPAYFDLQDIPEFIKSYNGLETETWLYDSEGESGSYGTQNLKAFLQTELKPGDVINFGKIITCGRNSDGNHGTIRDWASIEIGANRGTFNILFTVIGNANQE